MAFEVGDFVKVKPEHWEYAHSCGMPLITWQVSHVNNPLRSGDYIVNLKGMHITDSFEWGCFAYRLELCSSQREVKPKKGGFSRWVKLH